MIKVTRELIGKTVRLESKTEKGKVLVKEGKVTSLMVSSGSEIGHDEEHIACMVHVDGTWFGVTELGDGKPDLNGGAPWAITAVS